MTDEQKAAFTKRINSARNAKKEGFTNGDSDDQDVSIPEVEEVG